MKTTIIKNGTTQIVLQPENEFEVMVLKEMNGATMELAHDKMVIIDKTIQNGAIISKKVVIPVNEEK